MDPFCCFSANPPAKADGKGTKAGVGNAMLEKQSNPNEFAVGLKNACCKDPCACCCSALFMPCGFSACYFRYKVLDRFGNGVQDYVCCQGYIPKMCCVDWPNCCQGSACGLCCEGCCCPMLGLSIARLHLMDAKQLRPDPMDYKIIAFSNFCQLLSCFCNLAAMCCSGLDDLAQLIDCIADIITGIVAGCMGAQINYELKTMKDDGVSAQTMTR
jgi:hypothetical protein